MGDFDYVKVVLDRIGDMRWMQIAIKPAKPLAFGLVDDTPVFGLPGNPVSSMVSLRAVRPPGACGKMAGHAAMRPAARLAIGRRAARPPTPTARPTSLRVRWPTGRRRGGASARPAARGRTSSRPWPDADALAVLADGVGSRPMATVDRSRRRGRLRTGRRRHVPALGTWLATMADAAGRHVRAGPPRPAHLGHRPLQLPLHLLHARRGHAVAAPRGAAHASRRSSGSPGIMVERFGVDGIRLTGGEPTVRAHLPVLVEKLAGLGVDLAMTTNGATPAAASPTTSRPPACGGSTSRSTRSDADRFEELTRRDELDTVLDGIDAAAAAGFDPVKINVVVMQGHQRRRGRRLRPLRPRRNGVTVRFIEFMPLDADEAWNHDQVVSPGRDRRHASAPSSRSSRSVGAPARPSAAAIVDGGGRDRRDRQRHRAVLRDRATGSGSPPTASSATASSPLDETDLRALLRGGPPTTSSPTPSRACGARQVGRPPDRPGALHPAAASRCRRSAAERRPSSRLAPNAAPAGTYTRCHVRARASPISIRSAVPAWSTSRPKDPTPSPGHRPGRVHMEPETASPVARGAITKGDVLAVARVAGIQAAKRTLGPDPAVPPAAGRRRCS